MATWYIDPEGLHDPAGNDGTGDGTSGTPWATLQKALKAATSGDTINVYWEVDEHSGWTPLIAPGECVIADGDIYTYGILTAALAYHASGILADSGTDYRAYGCLDSDGVTAADRGIVDSVGNYTLSGCLDSAGNAEDYGIIDHHGTGYSKGLLDATGEASGYGCLDFDGTTMRPNGIIDAVGNYLAYRRRIGALRG
jgi:hypothetical protein